MSYLLDLVQSFNETELEEFRLLDLTGKEELVRDEYARHGTTKKFTETNLPAKLGLTQSHFDKINSVLLNKIIFQLYEDDYRKILSAILSRGLGNLLLHEIKITHRNILKEKDDRRRVDFYRAAFDTLIKMFHPNYNSKLVHEYGKKYLEALGKTKTIQHEAYMALFAHYGDMIAVAYAGNEKDYKSHAWNVLEKWRKKLDTAKNPDADAYYYFVLGNYYKYFSDSAPLFLKANQDALGALQRSTEETNNLLLGRVLCEIGVGHMESNQFAQAIPFYEKAFQLSDEQFKKPYFHYGNYFYVLLCNRQPQKAKQIFEAHLQGYLQSSTNRSLQFDVLNFRFALSLHLGDYASAFDCLNEMRAFKKNEVTHLGNVIIRFNETLYYYLLKEDKVAAAMAKKNLKFLSLPENSSPQFAYHRRFIDCIDKLIKRKQGKLRFPEKLEQQIAGLQGGIFHMYNCLL